MLIVRLATPEPPVNSPPRPFLLPAGRPASGDISLHPLDVLQFETADEPRTEQWFDVGLDTGFGPS